MPTRLRHVTLAVVLVGALAPASLAVNSGRVEYYHRDALGNVRVVTDESGQVLERHDYLPFGEECTAGACADTPAGSSRSPRLICLICPPHRRGFDPAGQVVHVKDKLVPGNSK